MADVKKKCTKCGSEKPATTEFFYAHSEGKCGLRPDCKDCQAAKRRAYFAKHRESMLEQQRAYNRARRARERVEGINKDKDYYEKNKERLIRQAVEYNRRNKDQYLSRLRAWRKLNNEKVNVYTRNRRALMRKAGGFHTIDDVRRLFAEQNGRCVYCRSELGRSYHVDHIMPIARGGSNDPSNLQLLCRMCNLLKRDKLPEEFAREMRVTTNV